MSPNRLAPLPPDSNPRSHNISARGLLWWDRVHSDTTIHDPETLRVMWRLLLCFESIEGMIEFRFRCGRNVGTPFCHRLFGFTLLVNTLVSSSHPSLHTERSFSFQTPWCLGNNILGYNTAVRNHGSLWWSIRDSVMNEHIF
jgi:hypothetical protein